MRFGLDIPTISEYANPSTLADLAAEAEQAGWDSFFLWDTQFAEDDGHLPVVDPWIALAAIATHTQRIHIGAMLTPLARRRPWTVARQTVALDHLSGGRLIFGVGLGYQALDFTSFGESFDPHLRAQLLDEGLDILTGLWTGEPFSYTGTHYHLNEVTFLPRPVQKPRIPIWTAAGWPHRKPLLRAARWDGVYLMTVNQATGQKLTPDDVREVRSFVAMHRSRPEPIEIALNGVTSGDTSRDVEMVSPYVNAGATWWIEYTGNRETLAGYRERIRLGPPSVV